MGIVYLQGLCYHKDMKALYTISAIYLVILGTLASQPAHVIEVEANSPYLVCERDTYASNLHCATNSHRETVGLSTLAYSPEAESVAKERALHLCTTSTFTHDGWESFLNIEYTKAGENLATGFVSPLEAFEALIASPTHKANIEGSWDAMGVYTEYCSGKNVTVQVFTSI